MNYVFPQYWRDSLIKSELCLITRLGDHRGFADLFASCLEGFKLFSDQLV